MNDSTEMFCKLRGIKPLSAVSMSFLTSWAPEYENEGEEPVLFATTTCDTYFGYRGKIIILHENSECHMHTLDGDVHFVVNDVSYLIADMVCYDTCA